MPNLDSVDGGQDAPGREDVVREAAMLMPCPTCGTKVTSLPLPAPAVPEVTEDDVAAIRSRVEDYTGLADQYEQLSCPEGAKPMHVKAESMARILAVVEYCRRAHERDMEHSA